MNRDHYIGKNQSSLFGSEIAGWNASKKYQIDEHSFISYILTYINAATFTSYLVSQLYAIDHRRKNLVIHLVYLLTCYSTLLTSNMSPNTLHITEDFLAAPTIRIHLDGTALVCRSHTECRFHLGKTEIYALRTFSGTQSDVC